MKRNTSGNTVTYHGIPVRSDRIVFIIDLSGSMNAKIKVASGRTSSGEGDETTRLRVAKDELMKVLARACGHRHLGEFTVDDLTTFRRDMADLSGVAYGGVGN